MTDSSRRDEPLLHELQAQVDLTARAETAARARRQVLELIQGISRARARLLDSLERVHPSRREDALNLVDYVAVRSADLRELQGLLASLGLSSLGRMESGVLAHLLQVEASLRAVEGSADPAPRGLVPVWAEDQPAGPGAGGLGAAALQHRAELLLGPAHRHRTTRIMVTFPSEAADSPELVLRMVESGMDVARLNCAHDGPEEWTRMIAHLRAAEQATGRSVRIAMDLGGPKLRTGPILPGPQVEKLKPSRDALGRVLAPVRIWLGLPGSEAPEGAVAVPLQDAGWAAARQPGEAVRTVDTRGSSRTLHVVASSAQGVLLECPKTVYLATELELTAQDGSTARLGELPAQEQAMRVQVGDRIVLTRDMAPVPASPESPFRIGCSLPQAFQDAAAGQRVLIDDGKIGTVVRSASADEMELEVVRCAPGGAKLKAEKGLNLPDTDLSVAALTEQDRQHLPFVAEHADVVDMSFVRSPRDVEDLIGALDELDAQQLGVVLKIETVTGFASLPETLLTALRRPDAGVMIARGDLAVEAGFERMAEVQEEILWLCEAAHVPVIWATQVLESQAKSGLPSRAEVTDAAAGQRAECVMLNKGPFIDGVIATLDQILTRMDGHMSKKSDLLRRLESWALDGK